MRTNSDNLRDRKRGVRQPAGAVSLRDSCRRAGSISLVCPFYCLPRLPVSEVLTLTNIYPMWVPLLAWPLYKEPPSAQVWLSLASSLTGVVLIQQPHFAEGNFAAILLLVS